MKREIQVSLIRTNIKNILLAVMATNSCVLVISLVSFLNHINKDAVYNFIKIMIKESKYCGEVIKSILTKNL